jgi:hypothetical protein
VKKVLATILAFLYLATSTNAAITIHYCMGKVYSVDLVAKDKCSKCGMKSGKGCCKDQVKLVKIQDAHQLSGKVISTYSFPTAVLQHISRNTYALPAVFSGSIVQGKAPPDINTACLHILYRVFRI